MKKTLVILLSALAGAGYYLYKHNTKEEELIVPVEKDLSQNDYVVYFDEEEVDGREEMFV